MPASLGSTSSRTCSPAPERASGYGEGATQLRLKGPVFVFTGDREGHVGFEHDRWGQGRTHRCPVLHRAQECVHSSAMLSVIWAITVGCVTCHFPPCGGTLSLNTNTINTLYPTNNTPSLYVCLPNGRHLRTRRNNIAIIILLKLFLKTTLFPVVLPKGRTLWERASKSVKYKLTISPLSVPPRKRGRTQTRENIYILSLIHI